MDLDKLQADLLAVAEEIASVRAQASSLDEQAMRLKAQRADVHKRLAELLGKHRQLLMGLSSRTAVPVETTAGADGAADTDQAQMAIQPVAHPLANQGPRLKRILSLLFDKGAMDHRAIATIIGEEPKTVYTTLQDMKRRRKLVDGPDNALWTISSTGRAEIEAERDMFGGS